ncbi:MAG TPA: discoidin domain-containing protein, partial [Lentzea sp.]
MSQVSDLALNRPVSASSSACAATSPRFVTDGLQQVGVRGSGWRAANGDPQWVAVDLQAVCEVESFALVFEAGLDDPAFVPVPTYQPRNDTTGAEILSAAALSFFVEVSVDDQAWHEVYRTDDGQGAHTRVQLEKPVRARYVRLTGTRRSNDNPLGLNGFQVYGTAGERPEVKGWTDWRSSGDVPAVRPGPDNTVELDSGWHLTMDDFASTTDGAALAQSDVDTSTWLDATVPGTVLTSLVDQGHFPDPAVALHNMEIPEALSRHSWWYRRAFELPENFAGRTVWLKLDGAMQHAEIWLNGTKIGDVTNPFIRGSFDITAALNQGEQVLAVRLNPMAHPGSPTDKGGDGGAFPNSGQLHRDSPTYLSISGWDWMPAVRDRGTGIWDHVRLRATGDAVIGDPRVVTTLSSDHRTADIAISVPVRNTTSAPLPVTVQAVFDGVQLAKAVVLEPGTTEVALGTHTMTNPTLWWPNGYGDPHLHETVLTVTAKGSESDRRTTHFGIRELAYEQDPLKIRVNGVPIFCRGGNWGFDELLRRMPAERMDDVVALHRDMNFTMIRNWIGSSNREEFFAACDRHGILVWNDFWIVGDFTDDVPGFLDTALDTVTRYRHHPSIVVWCGANEASPPPNTDAGLRKIVTEQHTGVHYQSHS